MPHLEPYCAVTYEKKFRVDLSDLLSPPYDVINDKLKAELTNRSPFNSVQLCLVDDAQDPLAYNKLAERYIEWKAQGILERDGEPAFYLIEEIFEVEGQRKKRIGFSALLEVSPFERGEVLPHEYTLAGPKADRLQLLKTMGAEFSQVFFCYDDSKLVLESLYEELSQTPPFLLALSDKQVQRRVWRIADPSQQERLQSRLSQIPVLIADGHHRYETALHYSQIEPGARTRFVHGYFTNMANAGFGILPIHRVFTIPNGWSKEGLIRSLSEKFSFLPYHDPLSTQPLEDLRKEKRIGVILSFGESENYIVSRAQEQENETEVFLLQSEIFEKLFGWDLSNLAKGTIQFEHTTEEFLEGIRNRDRGAGMFLPPTNLQSVLALARQGIRMPQKSTFFFPKLASGLLIYELGQA